MQFEYKIIKHKTKGFMGTKLDLDSMVEDYNAYGQEGWELVSATDTKEYGGGTKLIVAIFKRQIK